LYFNEQVLCSNLRRENVLRSTLLIAGTVILSLAAFSKPVPTNGSWQVDTGHSDAQLVTDATDNGRTKVDATVGFARVAGKMRLDDADPTKSMLDLAIYPATSTSAPIDEQGKVLNRWLTNAANHTLVSFHSKEVTRRPDGRLQAKGNLVLTRIDRNVEATPSETYSGPVYGPPMIYRASEPATLVFDVRAADGKEAKDGGIQVAGSTSMYREDFPELVAAVLSTPWPSVVQDEKCETPSSVDESYNGIGCTGTFLQAPPPAVAPANVDEGYSGLEKVRSFIGNRLNILVHIHMTPAASGELATGGN
jgi:polyisoprenoid-binding protein YceI